MLPSWVSFIIVLKGRWKITWIFTDWIKGILLQAAVAFLFSVQHMWQCLLTYSQLIYSFLEKTYFILYPWHRHIAFPWRKLMCGIKQNSFQHWSSKVIVFNWNSLSQSCLQRHQQEEISILETHALPLRCLLGRHWNLGPQCLYLRPARRARIWAEQM